MGGIIKKAVKASLAPIEGLVGIFSPDVPKVSENKTPMPDPEETKRAGRKKAAARRGSRASNVLTTDKDKLG